MFLDFLLRNYLKNELVNFIVEKIIILKCKFSFSINEKLIFNQWLKLKKSSKNGKKNILFMLQP